MVASRDGAQARRGRSHTWWRANTARPRTGTGRRVQGGAGSERGRRPTVGGGGGLGKGLTGEVACELEGGGGVEAAEPKVDALWGFLPHEKNQRR